MNFHFWVDYLLNLHFRNQILLLSKMNLISRSNYLIVLRRLLHFQTVDCWQLQAHWLLILHVCVPATSLHVRAHTHTRTDAVGILCHLANSQQSLFLRWRLFRVIGPSVVMTLHLFSLPLCKSEKGNLVWHGARKMYYDSMVTAWHNKVAA